MDQLETELDAIKIASVRPFSLGVHGANIEQQQPIHYRHRQRRSFHPPPHSYPSAPSRRSYDSSGHSHQDNINIYDNHRPSPRDYSSRLSRQDTRNVPIYQRPSPRAMELQRIRRRLVHLRMGVDVMHSFPYASDVVQEENELYHDSMNNEDYDDNGSTY